MNNHFLLLVLALSIASWAPLHAQDSVAALKAKAEAGDAEAQFDLAAAYDKGQGVEKNPVECAKWNRKAADQGVVSAQFNLGGCYMTGSGVEKNLAEGMKWFRKAAEKGHVKSINNLALGYTQGDGVPQDFKEAMKWYRLSAAAGHPVGQYNLSTFLMNNEGGIPQDLPEAFKLCSLAAAQGHPLAQMQLAVDYEQGLGVAKNPAEAAVWYRKAAAAGNANAKAWVDAHPAGK